MDTYMSRAKGNEILTLWKLGKWYPRDTILMALCATGDLER